MKKQKTRFVMRPDIRQQIHDLQVIARQHRALAAQADASLAQILQVAYGIDISQEDWEIVDERKGILERRQGI